ncbi:MAG: DEAD/DEAH box helicase [Collinsella aerofaciens]
MYRAGVWNRFTAPLRCVDICGYLDKIDAELFDYIVIDEAHRVGAKGYQRILEHFKPKFCLGMTATPNRTDGYDVFALFNHVIAYQITLQDALREDMLAPFHYWYRDLAIDEEEQSDFTLFSKLTSEARVNHIIERSRSTRSRKMAGRAWLLQQVEEVRELAKRFTERIQVGCD